MLSLVKPLMGSTTAMTVSIVERKDAHKKNKSEKERKKVSQSQNKKEGEKEERVKKNNHCVIASF